MASVVSQMVVVLVNRELSAGQLTGFMSVGVAIKISSSVRNQLEVSVLPLGDITQFSELPGTVKFGKGQEGLIELNSIQNQENEATSLHFWIRHSDSG